MGARVAVEFALECAWNTHYDAFGRRIAKKVNGARTVYGWDGDTLAYESADERSTHYLYEPKTFVPMAQYAATPVNGIETPTASSAGRYTPENDPLQRVIVLAVR